MAVYRSVKEEFYARINNSDKISDDIKKVVGNQELNFFEVCEKFADIGINATKEVIKDKIRGVMRESDIDTAKRAAISFIKQFGENIEDEILFTIHEFHEYAVDWDNKRPVDGKVMTHEAFRGTGRYYYFAKLPDDVWGSIEKEIKCEL